MQHSDAPFSSLREVAAKRTDILWMSGEEVLYNVTESPRIWRVCVDPERGFQGGSGARNHCTVAATVQQCKHDSLFDLRCDGVISVKMTAGKSGECTNIFSTGGHVCRRGRDAGELIRPKRGCPIR